MADVFISYHTKSGLETVREIAAALENMGVSCWYANRDIKGGDFAEQIAAAIDECKVFLLLLNPQSNTSGDVRNEVKLAYDRYKEGEKIFILPYCIADCKPTGGMKYYLTRFHIVDRKSENTPELAARVGKLLGREPLQTKPAQPEPAPEQTPTQTQLPGGLRPITLEEFVTATVPKKETKPEPAPSIVLPARPQITFPIRKIYRPTIAAGGFFTVGIQTDGTVVGTGLDWYNGVEKWRGIVSLAAGYWHTVGLKVDGTVLATGSNKYGQCDISGWSGVVALAAGYAHTIGLKSDGTVLATGDKRGGQCNVSGWSGVVAVAAGDFHTVGLKADGTVLATGDNEAGQCNVSGWSGVAAVAAGVWHTIGLKADGTVLATGDNYGQCNVSGWSDVVAVAAGDTHTIGLKADGTVLAAGSNNNGQCNVSYWSGVVAVAAGGMHTIGLKADGTVLATGWNEDGQCNVQDWRLRLPEWVEI